MASQTSGPGAIRVAPGTVDAQRRPRPPTSGARSSILNTGDRPVQIGSHIHLADVNAALMLRPRRGQPASGSTSRPAPRAGSSRAPPARSTIVALAGPRRRARDPDQARGRRHRWLRSAARSTPRSTARPSATRCASATPTCGSRSRRTSPSVARRRSSAAASRSASRWPSRRRTRAEGALDTVITNAVVLDHWGVVRADVGIRDGRIVALGRSGNPDIADGVHPDLVIGPVDRRDLRRGQDPDRRCDRRPRPPPVPLPARRGAGDRHHHVGGGGTGPSEGSKATTVTPGPWHLAAVHRALDSLPLNVLLMGKGNTVSAPRVSPSRRSAGAAATRSTRTGARRRQRSTRRSGPPTSTASRWRCTPTASTRPATSSRRWRRSAGGRSTPSTPRARAAGTRPTSSRRLASRTSSPARPTRRCRTLSTPSPSTSTCSWSATTSTRGCPRTWRSPSPGSGPPRSRPRTSCTTSAPCRSRRPTPRRWAGSAR